MKQSIGVFFKRGLLILKDHAPQLMCFAGTAAVTIGAVMACKATTKLRETLDALEQKKNDLENKREEMDEREYKKAQTKLYIENGWALIKLYGPSVLTILGGVALLNGSSIVLQKRNTALLAAYATLRESYNAMKNKMIEKGIEQPYLTEETEEQLHVNRDGEQPKPGDEKTFWFMYDALATPDFSDAQYANYAVLDSKEKLLNKMLLKSEQKLLTINEIADVLNFRYKRFKDGDSWCVTFDSSPEASVDYSHLVDLGFRDNYEFTHGLEPCTELKIKCVYRPEMMASLIEA